jgi:predicted transcriptional regulator
MIAYIISAVLLALLTLGAVMFALHSHALRKRRAAEARARAVRQAFADGYAAAMGEYARIHIQTYRVVRPTPDRPVKTEYWRGKTIEEICRELSGDQHA